LQANALIEQNQGVQKQLVGLNGDLFQLSPSIKIIKNAVKVGRIDITEANKTIKAIKAIKAIKTIKSIKS
jgi:ribonuclease J